MLLRSNKLSVSHRFKAWSVSDKAQTAAPCEQSKLILVRFLNKYCSPRAEELKRELNCSEGTDVFDLVTWREDHGS